ncbi:Undecaprenyl diphosphate synthase [hydrothermal vent metagenome]|uniref:Undecaprenyl diphosphate synthase n=1 Tax=hydrothermal vent metagenome TaxID=652676 RepID=A0A3B1DHB3_9ZZZZ
MEIDLKNLPKHIAIIMDGNGRWAEERNLPRTQGHIEGVKRVEDIVDASSELGIDVVTLFTFSSENWGRPENEVAILMNIIATVLERKLQKLQDDNIRFYVIGRRKDVSAPLLKTIDRVVDATKNNTGVTMNMALNYGGRTEIIDAVRSIGAKVKQGQLNPEDISEDVISGSLYTKELPDPDLLIRTSGEQRISNFLLWQLSYAEFYFTDKLWPDFTAEEFKKAIAEYQHRERRFGRLKK